MGHTMDRNELVVRTYNAALAATVSATFRATALGIEVRTPNGMGVLLAPDDALSLYAWLGGVLGQPEVVR